MTTELAIAPMAHDEMLQMAQTVARGGLCACKTVEQAMSLMLLAQSEGMHPMQAIRQYHIIQGRPAMRTDAMQAKFQQQGGRIKWKERTANKVAAIFYGPDDTEGTLIEWTMDDAKRAGLVNKDNWRTYPRQMLAARVVAEGVRAVMPGVIAGVYTTEEVMDAGPSEPMTITHQEAAPVEATSPIDAITDVDPIPGEAAPESQPVTPEAVREVAEAVSVEPETVIPDATELFLEEQLKPALVERGIPATVGTLKKICAAYKVDDVSQLGNNQQMTVLSDINCGKFNYLIPVKGYK